MFVSRLQLSIRCQSNNLIIRCISSRSKRTFQLDALESLRLYFFVLCIRVVNMKSLGDLATHLTFICLI